MEGHCRDLWQREYSHLASKEDELSQRTHSRSGGAAYIPKTNQVTNSTFIVLAKLVLLQ